MTSKTIIISEIETAVKDEYSDWKIGVTNNPSTRKAQLGHPLNWLQWQAGSNDIAGFVYQHFINLGLESADKKPETGKYVFIFPQD